MNCPLNEEEANQWIHYGGLVKPLIYMPGYVKVIKPTLEGMLNKADEDCHNLKLRQEKGQAAIVRFNTIKEVMSMFDVYIEDMEAAIQYLKDAKEATDKLE